MRRVVKEAISGIVFIISLVVLICLIQFAIVSSNNGYPIAILIASALCLISMFALVAFSRSGWRLEGSLGEWIGAAIFNPLILLFYNKDKEQIAMDEREDQNRDEKYYRNRLK